MPTSKTAKKATSKATKKDQFLSDAELEALKDTKRERRKGSAADFEADFRAALDKLDKTEKALTERLHDLVMKNGAGLSPKTWYGLPAWANGEGKVICFFTPAGKFKERYGTFGFSAAAKIDDGNMWPTSFALLKLTPVDEAKLAALVKKAVG